MGLRNRTTCGSSPLRTRPFALSRLQPDESRPGRCPGDHCGTVAALCPNRERAATELRRSRREHPSPAAPPTRAKSRKSTRGGDIIWSRLASLGQRTRSHDTPHSPLPTPPSKSLGPSARSTNLEDRTDLLAIPAENDVFHHSARTHAPGAENSDTLASRSSDTVVRDAVRSLAAHLDGEFLRLRVVRW